MGIRGRFAPTPSGRMYLGNLLAALLAWLDARSGGGELVLRIEDLDTQRTRRLFAAQLLDDLRWLGLDWDQGGLEPDYRQSRRTACYEEAFRLLEERGLIYPCYCSRTERMAASAPHREDGAVVYSGRCFRLTAAERAELRRQIENGLRALPAEYRQVLILREMHQLSYEEIGQTLSLDPGTVKSRISRGRKRLQKYLMASGNFSGRPPSKEPGEEGCQ